MTEIAKFLRKLRIDRDESLGDMAKNLELSAAYLSAIENAKRVVPAEMKEKLFSKYCLSEEKQLEFSKIVAESRNSLVIPFDDIQKSLVSECVDTAVMFAHDLSRMNEHQLAEVKKLLQKISEESKPMK